MTIEHKENTPAGGSNALSPIDLRKLIQGYAQQREACRVEGIPENLAIYRIVSTNDRWQPFPVDILPEPIREYVIQASAALGCDPSMVALPLLAAVAAAIGNSRRIELKPTWREPAILWLACVVESGGLKSPAMDYGLKPLQKLQHQAHYENIEAAHQYEIDLAIYEKTLGKWRHGAGSDAPPDKPVKPRCVRLFTDDCTVEGLAALLMQNPRGLGLFSDELSGLFGMMDRYAATKGGDVAKYLMMHGGRPLLVDRKTSAPIYVLRASLNLAGTIQPATLRRCLQPELFSNGFAARFLLAAPPVKPKRWSERDIDPTLDLRVQDMFINLLGMTGDLGSSDTEMIPMNLRLDDQAKAAWIEFYNAHAQEQAALSGDLGAAWSKLEGYAARLALVIHCVRQAAGDPSLADPNLIDRQSIEAGVTLSRWFGNEAWRLYRQFGESPEHTQRRELVDLIQRQGGTITPWNLSRNSRQFGSVELAERALLDLHAAGLGTFKTIKPDGPGRPATMFVLHTVEPSSVETIQENAGNTAIVSTTAVVEAADGTVTI